MKSPDFPIGPQVSNAVADLLRENPKLGDEEIYSRLSLPRDHPATEVDVLMGRIQASEDGFDAAFIMKVMARQQAHVESATALRVMEVLDGLGMGPRDLKNHVKIQEGLHEARANYASERLEAIADLWSFVEEVAGDLSLDTEEIIWMAADYLSRGWTREQVKSQLISNNRDETRQEIEGETPDDQTSGSDHNPTP